MRFEAAPFKLTMVNFMLQNPRFETLSRVA